MLSYVFSADVTLEKYINEIMKPQSLDTLGNGECQVYIVTVAEMSFVLWSRSVHAPGSTRKGGLGQSSRGDGAIVRAPQSGGCHNYDTMS